VFNINVHDNIIKNMIGNRFLVDVGKISTEKFLVHYPIIHLIAAFGLKFNKELHFAVTLLVTYVISKLISEARKVIYENNMHDCSGTFS
jgi:peptidoglycan/LPS O-acetylase OafA/YrhL